MDPIPELANILDRLQKCPLNLARAEIAMFYSQLEKDSDISLVLQDIVKRNENELGTKVASIIKDVTNSSLSDLAFANTPSLRAAVGYQACQVLLREQHSIKFANTLKGVGQFYWRYQGGRGEASPVDAIRIFADVFLVPLVQYVHSIVDIHGKLVFLLSRYKQRSEWFPDHDLIEGSDTTDNKTEKRLTSDILRYLFDNGVDFSVQASTPEGGGNVDILPVLPDQGVLPIEVKVFDGASRNASYVSSGLAQAADYARKFNRPSAYFVVYNIANDTVLTLPGDLTGPNIIRMSVQGIAIYAVVADLKRTLSSSRSHKMKSVNVTLP